MKKFLTTFLAIIMVASVFCIESLAYDESSVDYEKIYLQHVVDSPDDWFITGTGAMLVDINSDGVPELLTVVKHDTYFDENGEVIRSSDESDNFYYMETCYEIKDCFSIIDGKAVKDKNRGTYTIVMPFLMDEEQELPTEEYVGVYVDGNNRHSLAMYGFHYGIGIMSEITYDEASGFEYAFNDMSVYDYELKTVPCAYVEFDGGIYSTAEQLSKAISTLVSEYKTKVENFEQERSYNCSSWAKAEVDEAMAKGLIPEEMKADDLTKEITRAEFAAIAIQYLNATGHPLIWHGGHLADVDDEHEYSWYIRGAYQLGITNGTGYREDGTAYFAPDHNITREQMATMLCRTLEKEAEYKSAKDWFNIPDDSDYIFMDDEEISDYAYQPVYFMNYKKIIWGIGNDFFAPKETATKEQAIMLALRMYKIYN